MATKTDSRLMLGVPRFDGSSSDTTRPIDARDQVCAAAIVGGIWADSWPLITPTVGGGHCITVGGDSVDELVEPPTARMYRTIE